MSDKLVTPLVILLLAIVIGVMSWRDMHPDVGAGENNTNLVSNYHAAYDATPAIVPRDLPVTISQGSFKYTPQGKAVFTRQGMPPSTFVQQQVSLQRASKKPGGDFCTNKIPARRLEPPGHFYPGDFRGLPPEKP
jgi:hypothetical protein